MTDQMPDPAEAAQQRLLDGFKPVSLEEWEAEAVRQLHGVSFEKALMTPTYEGFKLRPLYTARDLAEDAQVDTLPGFSPYARGFHPLGHLQRPWEIAQELPLPTAADLGDALEHDLARGQTAIVIVLDEASRIGLDPDEAEIDQVGAEGTSLVSLDDLRRALVAIKPGSLPIHVEAGSAGLQAAALLAAWAGEAGVESSRLTGSVAMDPLGELARQGELPLSLEHAYDELAALTGWAAARAPRLLTVGAHGYAYGDAGGSAVHELGLSLAAAVSHLRALEKRGLAAEVVAPRLRFIFGVGGHFFLEIAKLRAARLLWDRALATCGVDEPMRRAMIHVRTSRLSLAELDPHVNLLRGTTAALAAIVGGCDSLHVDPFDAALGLPDEFSRRLARNTQLILREESHLDRVVDPAGGAWYVERLTAELAERAWSLFQQMERAGGLAAALVEGIPQRKIAAVREERQRHLSTRQDALVGVNVYPQVAEPELPAHLPHPAALHARLAGQMSRVRAGPDHDRGVAALDRLTAIRKEPPVDPLALGDALVTAAACGATIGELSRALRGAAQRSGEDPARAEPIPVFRGAAAFAALRQRVEVWRARQRRGPQVFLACLGDVAAYLPRLDFTRSFFQVGGFTVAGDEWFPGPQEAAAAALLSGAPVVVAVGADETYPEAIPLLAGELRKTRAAGDVPRLLLAGHPGEREAVYTAAGVKGFLHRRSDALRLLTELAEHLGVAP